MRAVRGTKDLLPEDFLIYQQIIQVAQKIGRKYGYVEIATPVIEYTEVFNRTLGETSDIVGKEMYSFIDRGGDNLTLRPEFTAGVMRAVISNNLQQAIPLRFFSVGPLFRYDRPQAGRQRQFHQLNFELIGENTPYSDAETLKLASSLLTELGIVNNISLEINSLGCITSRQNYQQYLKEYFYSYYNDLSVDSQKRLEKNPLRILDSKAEQDEKIIASAPQISDYYTVEARSYFESLLSILTKLNISYKVNTRLVRGLDYYSHTAFEFTSTQLGAQSAVLSGGRYDSLATTMGSRQPLPAIGFGAGIERLALLTNLTTALPKYLAVIPIGESSIEHAYILACDLRQQNIPTLVYANGKVGKRIDKAFKDNCIYALFVGEDEVKTQNYKVKNLTNGVEQNVAMEQLPTILGLLQCL